jgi:hypothetical protein
MIGGRKPRHVHSDLGDAANRHPQIPLPSERGDCRVDAHLQPADHQVQIIEMGQVPLLTLDAIASSSRSVIHNCLLNHR